MIQYKRFVVNMVQVNSYLIWDESKEACIIDPGFSTKKEQESFATFLESESLRLKRSIATHIHFDHVLGAKFIEEQFGIATEMPEKEIIQLPSIEEQLNFFGIVALPGGQFDFNPLPLPSMVKFGHSEFQVIETPGHSPSHVSFYSDEDKLLFCGDVLFKGGYGRYDLWGGDYDTLMGSIDILLELSKDVVVLSGHGPQTTIGAEKNNFLRENT